jgi:hypothetical protein
VVEVDEGSKWRDAAAVMSCFSSLSWTDERVFYGSKCGISSIREKKIAI